MSYTDKDIQTLSELQHIRQNRGMYIGETPNPNHLVYEVLDNALDEANAKHASIVGVFIDQAAHTCIISDNGRGIPITGNVVQTIATKLFSGGKFKKGEDGSAYGIASGLHGIGLVAVTALSDYVEFIIYRDNKKATYLFEDAKITSEKIVDSQTDKRPFSTQVSFKPTKKYFDSLTFDVDAIRNRLRLASIGIEHLKLVLVVDGVKEVIECDVNDYFKEVLYSGQTSNVTPIFEIRKKIKDEEVVIKFGWDMNTISTRRIHGSVNLLWVNQGTHMNRLQTVVKDVFTEYARKEKLTFQPDDCFVGFRCLILLSLYKPEYSSQTKEKLSTSKDKLDHLYNDLDKSMVATLDKHEEVKNQILNFFEVYRKSQSANKAIVKGGKEVSRFGHLIDSKLKDCSSTDISKCELFITEGASAAGGLTQVRNPKYHAILGLKGKIPNLAPGKKDFLKNKEVVEIINALGTGINPDCNLEAIRYSKICISTDADADGLHITCLLMVLFLRLVPGLIKNQTCIYRVVMPLYGCVKAGKFHPFYSEETKDKFIAENPNVKIQRYKGLGEMNPDQLKVCMLDPETRKLELIDMPENEEEIFKIMTDAETKRGLLGDD